MESWAFFFAGLFVGAAAVASMPGRSRRKKSKRPEVITTFRRASLKKRSDAEILALPLSQMTGGEFERLMYLYFSDKGFTVSDVGKDGKDGGVDLVIKHNRTHEKTAVQLKCYENKKVTVGQIRELVGAKRNHGCTMALMITTSELTADAKREADERLIDYWHGALVQTKLKTWSKYNPLHQKRPI